MKSLISCCSSASLTSSEHTLCSDLVLCCFQHLGTKSLNLPLADLCFRCALLSWQVGPKAETGRAEGATCTTQSLFDEELGITAPQFVQTKALVLPASWHSSNTSLEVRQQHGKLVVCYHHCTRNALVLKGLNAKK